MNQPLDELVPVMLCLDVDVLSDRRDVLKECHLVRNRSNCFYHKLVNYLNEYNCAIHERFYSTSKKKIAFTRI